MTVRILEDVVVDQIAAGEVVERPASVLKELVENALDAGAREVVVHLKAGGADLVRVTDDGVGMGRDDAMLCIERHATSKIRTADDLVGVNTLGFRGEALPSIASVSRFELATRRAEDEVGTVVRVEGGQLIHVGATGCPVGTEVSVRQLFGNVPARRKFLRSTPTELAHCVETVHRLLVHRPEVGVAVWHDGRQVLDAPASDDPVRRLRDLLGVDGDALVKVDHASRGVSVTGLVSPAHEHRPTSTGAVYTFVHGRFVRDPVVRRALTEAYAGLLPKGRHPVVVLDVCVPSGDVDVNVHPAKTEVRFRQPRDVMQVMVDGIQAAIRHGRPAAAARRAPALSESTDQLDLLRPPVPSMPIAPPPRRVDPPPEVPPVDPSWREAPEADAPGAAPVVAEAPIVAPRPTPPAQAVASAPLTPAAAPRARPSTTQPVPPGNRPEILAVLGSVAVATQGAELVLVDLAAMAQAVAAAALTRGARAGGAPGRPLLAPVTVELGRAATARVVQHAELLASFGVEVSGFGPGVLAVMALPEALEASAPEALLRAASHALEQGEEAMLRALVEVGAPLPTTVYAARTLVASHGELASGQGAVGAVVHLDEDALRALVRRARD